MLKKLLSKLFFKKTTKNKSEDDSLYSTEDFTEEERYKLLDRYRALHTTSGKCVVVDFGSYKKDCKEC